MKRFTFLVFLMWLFFGVSVCLGQSEYLHIPKQVDSQSIDADGGYLYAVENRLVAFEHIQDVQRYSVSQSLEGYENFSSSGEVGLSPKENGVFIKTSSNSTDSIYLRQQANSFLKIACEVDIIDATAKGDTLFVLSTDNKVYRKLENESSFSLYKSYPNSAFVEDIAVTEDFLVVLYYSVPSYYLEVLPIGGSANPTSLLTESMGIVDFITKGAGNSIFLLGAGMDGSQSFVNYVKEITFSLDGLTIENEDIIYSNPELIGFTGMQSGFLKLKNRILDTEGEKRSLVYITTTASYSILVAPNGLGEVDLAAEIACDKDSLEFSTKHFQQETQSFWIKNTGDTVLQGSLNTSEAYVVSFDSFGLAVGDSIEVEVTFLAEEVGSFSDSLWIYSNAENSPEKLIKLNAEVEGIAQIELSETELMFSTVLEAPITKKFIVYNKGSAVLQATLEASSQFMISPATFDLAIGDSIEVEVSFLADEVGSFSDSLWIYSNAENQAETLVLLQTEVLPKPAYKIIVLESPENFIVDESTTVLFQLVDEDEVAVVNPLIEVWIEIEESNANASSQVSPTGKQVFTTDTIRFTITNSENEILAFQVGATSPIKVPEIEMIRVETVTGIEEENPEPVKVYPNPCLDQLMVEASDAYFVTICDIFGRNLLFQKGQESFRFDASELTKGQYIVEIKTKNGVILKKIQK